MLRHQFSYHWYRLYLFKATFGGKLYPISWLDLQNKSDNLLENMSSILILLGLKADPLNPLVQPPNVAPYHALFNFLWAYVVLSSRFAKMRFKIDHNTNPRLDLVKYGQRAVAEGKMTKRQLDFIHRIESCHANSMEHFPVALGAFIFATIAGVKTTNINLACAVYTASRVIYAVAYLVIERVQFTMIRSWAWWVSNFACIYLYWTAGKTLNAGRL